MKPLTRTDLNRLLGAASAEDPTFVRSAKRQIKQWLERGDGVAVYRNEELGHPELGRMRFFSFGGPEAFLPEKPPAILPDFPDEINWRYVLYGVYRNPQRAEVIEPRVRTHIDELREGK